MPTVYTAMTAALTLLSCALFAQTAPSPTFDVASVKPAAPQGGGRSMTRIMGGPGTHDPERITYSNISLMLVMTNAYDVRNFQISGPSWLDTERFDITAKVPPGTTKEQARIMMQNLLAERFQLKLHHDTKELTGYELVAAKGGPKVKESAPDAASADGPNAPPSGPPGPPKKDANGFPQLGGPGLMVMMEMSPKGPLARMTAKSQPISELVRMLGNQLKMPIIDKTGLSGKYDFNLEYSPDMAGMGMPPPPPGGGPAPAAGGPDEAGPDMLTAIREQLGLKLDSKKMPVDILVIDHAEKVPTEN